MASSYWLFKQEPSTYNYSQLEKDGKTVWDGVANNLALKHLRSVKKGDKAIFYHTGDERQAVGIMEVISDPYPDPKEKDESLVVVDVRPAGRLKKPVTLDQIKADSAFAQWELVRISRLSVMPVPEKLWERIMKMSG
ncbi:EVE domain-containing protein [Nitrososphaera viennensis]|nr:EVE domain-containing protein [Nitrososphaera viennensis]UVS68950.1 EVE domain-containing protein [Nitrososphaera viennensis]